jgi:hypothetical protein
MWASRNSLEPEPVICLEFAAAAVLIGAYLSVIVAALPFADGDNPVAKAIEGDTWLPPH